MKKLLCGVAIGFILCVAILSVFETDKLSNYANITIAIAACVATYFHYESIRNTRTQRIWDTNKDFLFSFSRSLSNVIQTTKEYRDYEYSLLSPHYPNYPEPVCSMEVDKDFKNHLAEMSTIYDCLISNELREAVKNVENEKLAIQGMINDDIALVPENYNSLIECYETLEEELRRFIVRLSGIENLKMA